MASSDRTPDMSRVISDLSRAINQLVDKVDNLGGTGRPGSTSGGRAQRGGELDLKETQKNFKSLNNLLSLTDKEIRDLRRGFSSTGQSLEHLYRVQNDAAKGLIANQRLSERAQQDLVAQINRNIRGHSFLGQSMANAGKKIEFLEQKLEETGKFLSQYGDILKDANAQSLSSITDHNELQKAIKKLNSEMVLSEEVQEMIRKQEFARAAQQLDDEAKNATIIRTSIRRTSTSFNQLHNVSNGLRDGLSKATDAIGAGFVKEAATAAGALGLIAMGAKQAYTQFWQTASAGFGGAFISLSKTAIDLGISLESLTRINRENAGLVARMGFKGFNDSLKESQIQLMQLGLTTEEAAKTRAALNEAAFLSGVDVKNRKAMAASANEQIKIFEDLRAMTGESIEALAMQTKAILNDTDTMKIMGSLNKTARIQLMRSINLERERLITMGLTNEAALGVIKSFQTMQNQKTTERIESGSKVMAAGSLLGIDAAKSEKAADIMRRGRSALKDPENAKFMADFAKELAAKKDNLQGTGDINDSLLADVTDSLTTSVQGIEDNMRGANLDRAISPEQKEANKALGRVPEGVAEASAKIESGMRILESPLVKIMVGVLGIGALLLKHFAKPAEKTRIPNDMSGADAPHGPNGPNVPGTPPHGPNGDGPNVPGSPHRNRPGDSVQGPTRVESQVQQMAKKNGWTEQQYRHETNSIDPQQTARDIAARRAAGQQNRTDAGRQAQNSRSIGSEALQERLRINREMVQNRPVGPPQPPRRRTLADRIDSATESGGRRRQAITSRVRTAVSERRTQTVDAINGFGERAANRVRNSAPVRTAGALGRAGGAGASLVGGAVRGAGGAVTGAVSKGLGSIMALGSKALPFIGLAVAGIQAFSGAIDGVNRAAEIFGVDTKKNALTSAQKISSGIAGALNTISFGLIPVDSTARLLNDVATDGAAVLGDYMETAAEFLYNKAVPMLYESFKKIMGFIGSAIVDVMSPSTWIAAFTGEGGDGGIVQSIIRSLWKALQFVSAGLMKGVIKVGSDLIGGMIDLIPDWAGGKTAREGFAKMKAESEKGGLLGFAAEDNKFSNFDNEKEAKERKEREKKKAIRDKKNGADDAKAAGNDVVQGTATNTGTDNLGLVNNHGAALTADQLAAQGVQATPASTGSPSVSNPSGTQAPGAQGASGGAVNTPAAKEPSKSAEETLLTNILDKMTKLVDLTDKGLELAKEDFKMSSTRQRTGNQMSSSDGFSPSLAAFMNMPI
jgi:hypothetical protein